MTINDRIGFSGQGPGSLPGPGGSLGTREAAFFCFCGTRLSTPEAVNRSFLNDEGANRATLLAYPPARAADLGGQMPRLPSS